MLPEQPASGYLAYLLRLWRAEGGWRASLMNPHTNQQQAFPSLEALIAFLTRATQVPAGLVTEPHGARPADDPQAGLHPLAATPDSAPSVSDE